MYQECPDQVFRILNFIFSHGHFGLGGWGFQGGGGVTPPPPVVYGHSNTSPQPSLGPPRISRIESSHRSLGELAHRFLH